MASQLLSDCEYACGSPLNLYASPGLSELATQAAAGRQLRILSPSSGSSSLSSPSLAALGKSKAAVEVLLCEDDYAGWTAASSLGSLQSATPYQAPVLSRSQISDRLPAVIEFAKAALAVPNTYLWGGTLGPNYDCSGLVQAAFASAGVWLPRDSYQQAAFTQPIAADALAPGDLIFFGKARVTHVALSLGGDRYLHSSGRQQGRNGIGIDVLSAKGDEVSQTYYRQLRGAGRVMESYRPQSRPFQC
ncbi:MAG: NlpC/P60 family protein [Elainellaceae cyanobacterium]